MFGVIFKEKDLDILAQLMEMCGENKHEVLVEEKPNGIGQSVYASIPMNIDGVEGKFVVDLTDTSKW